MATLFIDCGDTLITRTRLFNARGEEAWQPNWDVVAAVERWQIQGLGNVVVWSEKGADDAQRWGRRLMPHHVLTFLAKNPARPRSGDVAIDDVALAMNGVCYRPAESFLVAPEPLRVPASQHEGQP